MISWSVTSPILILSILIYYIIDVAVSSFSPRHKFETKDFEILFREVRQRTKSGRQKLAVGW